MNQLAAAIVVAIVAVVALLLSTTAHSSATTNNNIRNNVVNNSNLCNCAFASDYSTQDLLTNATARALFRRCALAAESAFASPNVGFDPTCGFTFDGQMLDYDSGELSGVAHNFSAPSKESVHVALIAKALNGDSYALCATVTEACQCVDINNDDNNGSDNQQQQQQQQHKFINTPECNTIRQNAQEQLLKWTQIKLQTYQTMCSRHPGYGCFLPWVSVVDGQVSVSSDWKTPYYRVPSLDNGEWVWGIYALVYSLRSIEQAELADAFQQILDTMAAAAPNMFIEHDSDGKIVLPVRVRAVTRILRPDLPPTDPTLYTNDGSNSSVPYLDDPYEGELFLYFLDLMSHWDDPSIRSTMWDYQRRKIEAVNYTYADSSSSSSSSSGMESVSVTVERGWWYSSHEKWKVMELPYRSVDVYNRVFMNGERARTIHSAVQQVPGLHACANDVAEPGYPIPDYVGDTGIQQIAYQPAPRRDLVTPYGAFPVILANDTVGLLWYHRMLLGPRMQGPYGSTEAVLTNGTLISPLLTWDTKMTTALAMVGGIGDITEAALRAANLYQRFSDVVTSQYSIVFKPFMDPTSGLLPGELLELALPNSYIPTNYLGRFSSCN